MRIKVLTLNLWDDLAALDRRETLLIAGLQRLQPDVACFQEVSRNPVTRQIRSDLFATSCGLSHRLFSGFGETTSQGAEPIPIAAEGLSILSRYPVLQQKTIALPNFKGDFPRQAFLAEFAITQRRIVVVTTHLAYPPAFSREREIQTRKVLDGIDQFTSDRDVDAIILAGDFNDEWLSLPVRAIIQSKFGFRDAYSTCHPNDPGLTFTSRNPYAGKGFEPGLRIDFIFATPKLRPIECSLVFDGSHELDFVSDHFGVMCEFAIE